MSGKMKKIRGMLDGLRQSVGSSSPKSETEIEETLRSEDLQVCKVRFLLCLRENLVVFIYLKQSS